MALLHSLRQAARHQAARHAGTTFGLQQLRCFAAPGNQLQLIKELRERTGAPISDVKTALLAAGWDLGECNGRAEGAQGIVHEAQTGAGGASDEAAQLPPVGSRRRCLHRAGPPACPLACPADNAVNELRKKGMAAANKKASRHAAEGLVGLAKGDAAAAVVEVRLRQGCIWAQSISLASGAAPGSCGFSATLCPAAAALRAPRLLLPHILAAADLPARPPARLPACPPVRLPAACPPARLLPACLACLQINSETDFVARNEQFHGLVGSAAAAALGVTAMRPGSSSELEGEALKGAKLADGTRCVCGAGSAGPAAACQARGPGAWVCPACLPAPPPRQPCHTAHRLHPPTHPPALHPGCRLEDAVVGVAGSVRENVRLRRGFRMAAPGGVVGAYLHQAVAPGLGRIAGLVALQSSSPLQGQAAAAAQVGESGGLGGQADGGTGGVPVRFPIPRLRRRACPGQQLPATKTNQRCACSPRGRLFLLCLQELAHKLAMQVVGAAPKFLDRAAVPSAALQAESAVLREQALKSGGWGRSGQGEWQVWVELVGGWMGRPCTGEPCPVRAPAKSGAPQLPVPLGPPRATLRRETLAFPPLTPAPCRQAGEDCGQDGGGAAGQVLRGGVPAGAVVHHGARHEGGWVGGMGWVGGQAGGCTGGCLGGYGCPAGRIWVFACITASPVRLQAAQHAGPPSLLPTRASPPSASCCLLSLQVQDVLKQRGKEVGSELRLTDFVRVQVGEGLEQEQKSFADEVAETLKAAA